MTAPKAGRARAGLARARRALVGATWVLAWTLAWALALLGFADRARARSPALAIAVSDGPVSLPIYVAQARGLFAAEGLAVQLHACSSGRQCYAQLADGLVDVATASELVVVTGDETRPDIDIIATLSASSQQIKVVARRSAGVVEVPQIRGKRIGTVAATSAQYFLDNWLVYNDIDPKTVTVVVLAPDKIVAALGERRVDAVAIWEPLAANAVAALLGDAVSFTSERVYTQHFNLVTDHAGRLRRGDDLTRLMRALIRADRFIAEQPVAAQAILAERLGVTPAVAAAGADGQDYRTRLDQSLVSTMQSQARWAVRNGLAAHPGDVLRMIDDGPLRRAAPDAVGIAR